MMKKIKSNYSLAVGSKTGPRSAVFNISISKTKKETNVYVNTASQHGIWHASIHRSGRWHVTTTQGKYSTPPIIKSHIKRTPEGELPTPLLIAIPESSLRKDRLREPKHENSQPDTWLPCPLSGGVAAITLVLFDSIANNEEWLAKPEGFTLLRRMKIEGTTDLLVLCKYFNALEPVGLLVNSSVTKQTSQLQPIILDSPMRRGFIFNCLSNGTILIIDIAID